MESSALSLAEISKPPLGYASLAEAFPDVDPGLRPFGSTVLVQMRTPMTRMKSGLFLPQATRETEKWNTQVAKVVALGPLAFKSRDTLEPWPEGAWVKPGTFVRVPKYAGDRWEVPVPKSPDRALFILFKDGDLRGEITINPLDYEAYIPSEAT